MLRNLPLLAQTQGQILKDHVGLLDLPLGALLSFHFGNHFGSKSAFVDVFSRGSFYTRFGHYTKSRIKDENVFFI